MFSLSFFPISFFSPLSPCPLSPFPLFLSPPAPTRGDHFHFLSADYHLPSSPLWVLGKKGRQWKQVSPAGFPSVRGCSQTGALPLPPPSLHSSGLPALEPGDPRRWCTQRPPGVSSWCTSLLKPLTSVPVHRPSPTLFPLHFHPFVRHAKNCWRSFHQYFLSKQKPGEEPLS